MKKKILRREIKHCAAMAVVVETNKKHYPRNQLAMARNTDDQLPEVIIQKMVYKRSSIRRIKGFKLESAPLDDAIQSADYDSNSKSLKSTSVIKREVPESNLGWPLLRRTSLLTRDASRRSKARSMSLVEWAMSLPGRSLETIMENRINSVSYDINLRTQSSSSVQMYDSCENQSIEEIGPRKKLPKRVDIVLKLDSYSCKQFSYKQLERATSRFSSDNLIGEGGCSNVYKGRLGWGKLVAVKVLKHYEEARRDFSLEVEILSSLQHKHITRLIGICTEDDHSILVYNFLSKGSLEDILQGSNEKSILRWKVRFKLAISIAKALNYLHSECNPSVIHRDVKSSNILLSDDFQPRLSDFGLAMWGVTDSASTDIVGTFGYIAPEYFMDGRVSNKIDIYSFGVVLLELLSGNKPISHTGPKGQESLVKWAMPLLESGNLEALLDPKLGDEFDTVQMQRMVLAATLCIKQSPRLRPNASQILELLQEEKQVRKWMNNYVNYVTESSPGEFDKLSSESLFLGLKFQGLKADSSLPGSRNTAVGCVEKRHHLRLKDYLEEEQD